MDNKSFIYEFINKQSLMAISTINVAGKPESAVVGFGQTKDLEIIFGTDNTSRKYTNILNNPNVALVIGWNDTRTVQLEGTAKELSREEIQLVKDTYWKKTPSAEKYDKNENQRYIIISPNWVRYTDISKHPFYTIELELPIS